MSRRFRLFNDERGVTLVEFAFVAPVLCLTLMGFFDLGYRTYVGSVLQGALHEAARLATVGDKTLPQIDAHVKARLLEFSEDAEINVDAQSYSDFSQVKQPERIAADTPPLGVYNKGDCWEDYKPNGKYDSDRGNRGLGGAEDVIRYEVSIEYPRLTPMPAFLGWSQNDKITGSTVLRNQPFAARPETPLIKCS
jgi:Flp pilus assembly pilin Flp